MKFTQKVIENLQLPAGKSEYVEWDETLPGFGVRVRPTSKSWRIQYRVGKRQRSESLGDVRKVDLEAARRIARQRFAQIELGRDPGADRDAARRAQAAAELTLGKVVERYLDAKHSTMRPSTYRAASRYLRVYWQPLLSDPLDTIKRAQVAALLGDLAKVHGRQAARVARRNLSALYSWAMREELAETNPVANTNDPGAGIRARDRVLNDDEIHLVWSVCSNVDDDFCRIIRLLLLTACRREEIGGLRWSEIDLETRLLTLPASRVKNHRQHELALPEPALAILRAQPRQDGREFVFGRRGVGFTGWSFLKMALDKRLAEAAGKSLAPWSLHDLRRTGATRMAELVPPHVVEEVLNHASGHKAGVAGIYNRASYSVEKKMALAMWAEKLMSIVEQRDAKVLTLPQRA